jgi:hypothetical protein
VNTSTGALTINFPSAGVSSSTQYYLLSAVDSGSTSYNYSNMNGTQSGSSAPGASTTANFTAVTAACTITSINAEIANFNTAGADNITVSLFHYTSPFTFPASPTPALTCTASGTGTLGNIASCTATGSVSVAKGDLLFWGFKDSSTTPYYQITAVTACQ